MKNLLILSTFLLLSACAEDETVDIQETAQQIGDVMASVDESGGSSAGSLAFMESQQRFIAAREKNLRSWDVLGLVSLFQPIPTAQATACKDTTFSPSCTSSSQRVRDLNGCTIGSASFTGDITLDFSNPSCNLSADGDTVDRSPNFTVTGRRGATLTVSKTGTIGQRITHVNGENFTFSNDGVRRLFQFGSTSLFDYTTQTTSDITVTGTNRAGRVMSGGNLRVTDNLSSVTCNYVPTNVTWTASCNCPTSGSWAGTCSDGKSSAVNITGCGTASITMGEDSESLSFDRCYSTN